MVLKRCQIGIIIIAVSVILFGLGPLWVWAFAGMKSSYVIASLATAVTFVIVGIMFMINWDEWL